MVADEVRVEDIPEKAKLIGRLGVPLGQIVTVTATIIPAEETARVKGGPISSRVSVVQVDGRDIQAVVMPYNRAPGTEVKEGKQVSVVGFETGGFLGTPADAWKHRPPYQTTGFYFESRFVILK
jgi:hypothetical protein